jgi:hypothetical protein
MTEDNRRFVKNGRTLPPRPPVTKGKTKPPPPPKPKKP